MTSQTGSEQLGTSVALKLLEESHRFALLVIDVQNDFTRLEGVLGSEGRDTGIPRQVVSPINRFTEASRNRGIPVFFTQMIASSTIESAADKLLRAKTGRDRRLTCVQGTWGAELDSDLTFADTDYFISKNRYSAFVKTTLQDTLIATGRDAVFVCGLTADVCVDATARHAFMLDYHVIVLSDLIAAFSKESKQASLSALSRNFAHVYTSDEVLSIWRKSRAS